ncbi:MAG TPA: Uma2 family endonuclease [Blastocatellia bacterium]|nr:Uma2 family endonuclease [Blastocatellia bacterium]
MSLPRSEHIYTVEEYLALERQSEERHEFLDGQIYAMAGESEAHADISVNLVRELSANLRDTSCRVWTKDTKVRCGPTPTSRHKSKGLYSYPDVVVVCGERQYYDQNRDVLLNPKVIIEILSQSTEAFDRGEKWMRYQTWLPILTDYLLVSQSKPLVEHFERQSDSGWRYSFISDPYSAITLPSIGCSLRLSDIYDRVVFPAEPAEMADEP